MCRGAIFTHSVHISFGTPPAGLITIFSSNTTNKSNNFEHTDTQQRSRNIHNHVQINTANGQLGSYFVDNQY